MPVDVNQAIDLKYNHHLSYDQIAKIQGVSPQAIHQKVKDLLPIPETKVFQNHRADILSNLQLKLLSNLDDKRIKGMHGRDLVVSAGILYDKERLERGQSTEIISYDAGAIDARYQALQALLRDAIDVTPTLCQPAETVSD
jgi:hypothetical protein